MASVRFETKGKKNPSHLYVRFYHSREFDEITKSGILINPAHWNNRLQRFKSIAGTIPDKDEISKDLENLKIFIVSNYNQSYKKGELISKEWLDERVDKFNNRPTHENDTSVFFVPFVEQFIEDSKTRINPATGKPIEKATIRKYGTTLKRLQEFEVKEKKKLKHIDIGFKFFKGFVSFLSIDCGYKPTTMNKYFSQIKMFCDEVKIKGYKYNPEYESRRFYVKRSKVVDTYLNEEEINKIYELEIANDRLDKIRDLFIIGLWTGLRVGDLRELNRLQISGNNILISSTEKNNAPAKIPIHPQIKSILNKRNGKLPQFNLTPKSLENLFNKKVKVICKDAGITTDTIGDLRNTDTNRDERGIYPKYKLISSHTCRRSFITNHLGVLPDRAIMTITTHSSIEQLHRYDKKTNEEYIEEIRRHWEAEKSKNLKIV